MYFRDNPSYEVVAFTAAQIPGIDRRIYPHELAGKRYPDGIPVYPEPELATLIRQQRVHDVFFAYSDVSHDHVMHLASTTLAAGATFHLLGPHDTMLPSQKTVIAVVASRTGAGKSTVSRKVVQTLREAGRRPVVVRHPMPYGKFDHPVQRFATPQDLDRYGVTIEEREEYQGHLDIGVTVYAGVDYERVLWEAEKEADVLVWDGGNNDLSFYTPQLTICVVDPLRPGHESRYHPGEANVRAADVIVVNKVNIATRTAVAKVAKQVRQLNGRAKVFQMRSEVTLDQPSIVRDRRVLVVEDGPSVTHGGLPEGAGAVAARNEKAELVDPRGHAVGSIAEAYQQYPSMGPVLPALGYSQVQLKELETTINSVNCEAVVLGTPADLTHLIQIRKPVARVRFEAFDLDKPGLHEYILEFSRTLPKTAE